MKKKFAFLFLGALVALAIPASAMASMYPAGHQFEIAPTLGSEPKPTLGTSLGTCQLTKISGQIPAAPKNTESSFEVSAPTFGTCTAGTSISGSGKWKVATNGYEFNLFASTSEALVLRFSSLPGCKLTSVGIFLGGIWSNGTTTPALLKAGYHAHSTRGWVWANDGGSCALAGQTEAVSYKQESGTAPSVSGASVPATDVTSPSTPLIVNK